jgi:hypothetical protein
MRKFAFAALTLAAITACTGDAPTMPVASASSSTADRGQGYYPGQEKTFEIQSGKFVPLNCSPRRLAEGSAWIGPSGGVLQIGPHRLIVPAGALTRKVFISGTVPAGRPFQVDLQPHGLIFRKAAGLILDATSCVDVPDIVYLIDQYTQSPPIRAIYSEWWKAIACPIWHFSGYMVDLGEGSSQ